MDESEFPDQAPQANMRLHPGERIDKRASAISLGSSPGNNNTSFMNGPRPGSGRNSPQNSPAANRMNAPVNRSEDIQMYNFNTSSESLADNERMRNSTMMSGQTMFADGMSNSGMLGGQSMFAGDGMRDSVMIGGQNVFPDGMRESVLMSGQTFGDIDGPDPRKSFAEFSQNELRTNLGKTKLIMNMLSEMWIIHTIAILGSTYYLTFYGWSGGYSDDEIWNYSCWWKIGWILPLPYTIICFFSLVLPFRTPKFLNYEELEPRRIDNLYILTVTKGDNREAVMRAWNAHKHLEGLDPCIRVHVLTDEPYYFDRVNCFTCPKGFTTGQSKYKARALEWYRQTMKYSEYDWVLHLDEESVIDDESVRQVLNFIRYQKECTWGQGVIIYNQYRYWKNWFFTVGDAIRVGDDLARFHLQYDFLHSPTFGAHGSFLLTNGVVENAITWDLGSLTEDYQFATHAWQLGFKCGKIPGIIREQSPIDLIGFLKQRRRWYVGIRRLPQLLPKIWWFFWTIGTLSLYFTVASIILGFFVPLNTPRWFGFLKDFSFCNYVYLYILGIFIQDIDKGKNPLLIIIHIPMTFVIQFVTGAMEAMAVMYGLIFPPSDFDVIKK